MVQHVLPINDSDTHEEATTCHCQPKVLNENGNIIVVHNSFDGRELVEEFNSILEIKNRVQYDLIKNKCPLAFTELKKMFDDEQYGLWLNPGYNGYLNYWESRNYGVNANKKWNERNLYELFDEKGFIPNIFCADASHWCYSFKMSNGDEMQQPYKYSNRNEAEAACFTELFYQLEKMLNVKPDAE